LKILWWGANVVWLGLFIYLSFKIWLNPPMEVTGALKTLGFGFRASAFMMLIVGLLIVIIIQLAILYNLKQKNKF